ncbi:MAG TPA: glycosyltransferase [Solirubrobacteraceae bacterium]
MAESRRVVLLGAAAQMPFSGVWWQVRHYLEGLRRLGHDVHYVEDTGNWPYDPDAETVTDDAKGAAVRLATLMDQAGFTGRWAYVNGARDGEVWGLSSGRLADVLAGCEVLINLSGATVLKEAHRAAPIRIYLETDPVTPQLEIALGSQATIDFLAAHTDHFTFGERIGQPGCPVPVDHFSYLPTRQPVVLDFWPPPRWFPEPPPSGLSYTTIASWDQPQKDIVFCGETYTWSKSVEFMKLLEVPGRTGVRIELALALDDPVTIELLRRSGFGVQPAAPLSRDPRAYRDFITASGGEFTAAKDQNVRMRSGWFSDRTATYLATGRPAIVQDTGFEDVLPTGDGLLSFRTAEEAVDALERVGTDYARHSRAARELAAEHFRAETVLAQLLERAGAT